MSNVVADLHPKVRSGEDLARRLREVASYAPFPVDSLGPMLGGAARAIADGVSAPKELAAQSVLAVAAFAAQDKGNVRMDGRTIPLSLFLLTVAESGDRKSACDRVASHPLMEWQRSQVESHRDLLNEFNDEEALYAACHKEILGDKSRSREEREVELRELKQPQAPQEPLALCQEPTLEGLQRSFRAGRPSQALLNDEGAQFFGGHAMSSEHSLKTIAGLSKFWDGAPIFRTRAAMGETAAMYDRRLSLHLLVQPIVADSVLSDRLMAEQGILARFLIAKAESLAGTRMYKAINPYTLPEVEAFHARITELLSHEPQTDADGALELPNIEVSPEARNAWIDAYNVTERELAAGRTLELIKPTASKAGENAHRLAGVFAVLEGTAAITHEQMLRAWELMRYYLQGSLRAAQIKEDEALERGAREVYEWICEQDTSVVNIQSMQKKLLPSKHRVSVAHIRALMAALTGAGVVKLIENNGQGEPCTWEICP